MKIKAMLLEDSQMVDKAMGFLLEKIPSSSAQEELHQMMRSCIELDTGGNFDELPEETKAPLQKGMASYLARFGRMLLSALYLDFSSKKGTNPMLGIQAIATGLKIMHEQIGFAFDEMEIGSSSKSVPSA